MNKILIAAFSIAIAAMIITGLALVRPVNVKVEMPQEFGAVAGPVIPWKYLSIGGIQDHYEYNTLTTASTTICSIKSPAATSTLMFASVWLNTATATAITLDMAKTSSMNGATTTGIYLEYSVAASAADVGFAIMATSTPIGSNMIFKPNQYLRVAPNVGGKGVTSLAPTGVCKAIFRVIE